MKKLKFKDVKWFAQGHKSSKWGNRNLLLTREFLCSESLVNIAHCISSTWSLCRISLSYIAQSSGPLKLLPPWESFLCSPIWACLSTTTQGTITTYFLVHFSGIFPWGTQQCLALVFVKIIHKWMSLISFLNYLNQRYNSSYW